ncbi:hypothetical protein [Providencia phage PSTCR6]|nr:hypothetical protein [Providencia phage PSTCR6]
MKLQRISIKLNDPSLNNVWFFNISDSNEELLEKAETLLRSQETPVSSDYDTWDGYCDSCSDYADGQSAGFWIPVDQVSAFKESWKKVKKLVK